MTELEHFARLKHAVLEEYRKHFPYFSGDWKSFSSQDIQNLISLVEENLRETVSEKWIYTHLKPAVNEKLPRKDMLDIFSRFCGYSGWDEFVFEKTDSKQPADGRKRTAEGKWRKSKAVWVGIAAVVLVPIFIFFGSKVEDKTEHAIKITDEFTGQPVEESDVKIYKADSTDSPVEVKDGKIAVGKDEKIKLVVTSPYYRPKQVVIAKPSADTTVVRVKPDDHAMMLKAFLKSDIKDWQTRKMQLGKILSDDLEVIVMLKDNLGAEYFNKDEFAQKLIIPTPSLRKMKIIEIQHGKDNKIRFVRMAQE